MSGPIFQTVCFFDVGIKHRFFSFFSWEEGLQSTGTTTKSKHNFLKVLTQGKVLNAMFSAQDSVPGVHVATLESRFL